MTRGNRYLVISLVYLLVIIGLVAQSYTLLIAAVAASVSVGMWIEKVDNRRDEKFKHRNALHNYHH